MKISDYPFYSYLLVVDSGSLKRLCLIADNHVLLYGQDRGPPSTRMSLGLVFLYSREILKE